MLQALLVLLSDIFYKIDNDWTDVSMKSKSNINFNVIIGARKIAKTKHVDVPRTYETFSAQLGFVKYQSGLIAGVSIVTTENKI